ncbi:SMC family ATPase [Geitlerinema sp. PCC 9228]|uniref:exonuclease subunit SbcC n=1 Tax=Geitlerinema sp. PCC 9228 TaxID=111611 RepID=UPI0008F99757|nr:SMC family ATPase [Geitlerinema sp. PCC 9228]
MIPYKLTLKNFLSYHQATINLKGLHTACICGANGAGKSSLLEAMAWAIWGQSRAASEDDLIYYGAKEVQVDFIFHARGHTYRIIRRRRRRQSASLEFQVANNDAEDPQNADFRSLTERGVRATQQKIIQHIRLDYDTFINSSYLRQGRADEFMLKRPKERKQVLAELLKLDRYETLAEQAKEKTRNLKAKAEATEPQIQEIDSKLQEKSAIARSLEEVAATIEKLQNQQEQDQASYRQLQAKQNQRQTTQQQLQWHQEQVRHLQAEYQDLEQQQQTAQQQRQKLDQLLAREAEITAGYQQYRNLQAQEEEIEGKYNTYQQLETQRQQLTEELQNAIAEINERLVQSQTQLENLQQQEQELQPMLEKTEEVEAAVARLQDARNRLHQLDNLQTQVSPLLQQRQEVQNQLDRLHAQYTARWEALDSDAKKYRQQLARTEHLERELETVEAEIAELEKTQTYKQRVEDKGKERRSFLDQLKTQEKEWQRQMDELEQKQALLENTSQSTDDRDSEYPPCPLCDRPLDEYHQNLVREKTTAEQQELRERLWLVREQITVSEREIQVLRQEYTRLKEQLTSYNEAFRRRGQLQSQLENLTEIKQALADTEQQRDRLGTLLASGVDSDLSQQLQQLDAQIVAMNYDEKNHALVRGEVENLRWAEIKQGKIEQAKKNLAQIRERQPQVTATIQQLQTQREQMQSNSELAQKINRVQQQMEALGYDRNRHNQLRQQLRQLSKWEVEYQTLQQAKQDYPQVRNRVQQLQESLQARSQKLQQQRDRIAAMQQELANTEDPTPELERLEKQIQQRREALDQQLALQGSYQQQASHLEALQTQRQTLKQQLQSIQRQKRVYQELSAAFGKNGIQALTIENVLPQLEAETNHILSRLSANQLHVQFVTQKQSRSNSKKNSKLIDTLDIYIADARGTRPYETYSGGEAFRINFAIRLALAKLLAQRSGTPLQMLIVDEGFGTQDNEGCERLIAAIEAIAPDFACILAVTHIPHLKEAFQTRIEVRKDANGSQARLLV